MQHSNNKLFFKGFSLIELMVVIAIVAILAAVAGPAYQNYTLKTKIASGYTYLQGLMQTNNTYYNNHGVYGNLQQLGYPFEVGVPTQTGIPADLASYVQQPYVAALISEPLIGYTCEGAAYAIFLSNFGDGAVTATNNNGSLAYIQNFTYIKDGIVNQACYYTFGQNGTPLAGDYLNNCTNTAGDGGAWTAQVSALLNTC